MWASKRNNKLRAFEKYETRKLSAFFFFFVLPSSHIWCRNRLKFCLCLDACISRNCCRSTENAMSLKCVLNMSDNSDALHFVFHPFSLIDFLRKTCFLTTLHLNSSHSLWSLPQFFPFYLKSSKCTGSEDAKSSKWFSSANMMRWLDYIVMVQFCALIHLQSTSSQLNNLLPFVSRTERGVNHGIHWITCVEHNIFINQLYLRTNIWLENVEHDVSRLRMMCIISVNNWTKFASRHLLVRVNIFLLPQQYAYWSAFGNELVVAWDCQRQNHIRYIVCWNSWKLVSLLLSNVNN